MAQNSAFKREPSKYTRVSPGVYRNQQGQLTGPAGSKLPTPPVSASKPLPGPQMPQAQPNPQMVNKPRPFQPGQEQQNMADLISALKPQNPSWNLPTIKPYQPPNQMQQPGQTQIKPWDQEQLQSMYEQFLQWMNSQQGQQQ